MPRRAGGRNNPSHKKARKREREQLDQAAREARFHAFAEQNGLEYVPNGQWCGFRARRDLYEWVIDHAKRIGADMPRELLMGSAMGWLYEQIAGYEAGEKARVTKREDAEKRHADNLFEAALKRLHQWIPQPVPGDFVCPYTGDPVDKRKILATGTRYEKIDGATASQQKSYLYDGHDTLVLYRTGHRGEWHTARETWDGSLDSQGNRMGVQIEKVPFGEIHTTRQLGGQTPGLPWRGVPGYSGQAGRPILRTERGPRPSPIDQREVVETVSGFKSEAEARKQAMLFVLSANTAVMGKEHIDPIRAKRMRGGAHRRAHVQVCPPGSETSGERLTHTLPAHLWSGEIVEDPEARRIVKKRRVRKKPEDSKEVRDLIRKNRFRALR